jgi:hypothetical protein
MPRLVADGLEAVEFLQSAGVQGQLNERGKMARLCDMTV